MNTFALELSPQAAELTRYLVALAIPIAVGLLTKSSASAGLKSTLSLIIAAIETALIAIADSRGANTSIVIQHFVQTVVITYAAYAHVWKPTGIAGTVAATTGKFGLGSPPILETDDKGMENAGQKTKDPEAPGGEVYVP